MFVMAMFDALLIQLQMCLGYKYGVWMDGEMLFMLLCMSVFAEKCLAAVCDANSKHAFSINDDGVMLLNVMHRNHPLTILGTHHEDGRKHLVAMLTEISDSTIENQVFNLAYQATSRSIWLRLKKDPCIKVAKSYSSLEGVRQDDTSSLLYIQNVSNDHEQFQILSDGLCLTVDKPNYYDDTNGRMLSFGPCDANNKDQIFTIISSLKGSVYLHPEMEKDGDVIERIINRENMTKRIVKSVEISMPKNRY
ncbi:hypothetical protein HK407_08g12630 [Ordospora pajunii]|uniref:uncharacterized protein n=1 Tax=Ordospora pajunii TaxID=3039483 RepID=UPI0029526DFA|nr:uncharacterized protein HK407_08g12630 [Ordospora pajunii]KAH9411119.1 hypothetical protein HK407_08g12630 [Ordospora pajunii]